MNNSDWKEVKERFVKIRLKNVIQNPFFGTLLLHANIQEGTMERDCVPTMATDGFTIYVNTEYSKTLSDPHFEAIQLHEILHMALKHVSRSEKFENMQVFNIAADVIVNGILLDNGYSLPKGVVSPDNIEDFDDLKAKSVEEVYWILMNKIQKNSGGDGEDGDEGQGQGQGGKGRGKGRGGKGLPDANSCIRPDLKGQGGQGQGEGEGEGEGEGGGGDGGVDVSEADWDDILNKAQTLARMKGRSPNGVGIGRLFEELGQPKLNWKDILYRYITSFPIDFTGWDRRFIYQGDYVEDLDGHKNTILSFIDTSASVDKQLLTEFVSEIHGAVNQCEAIDGEVYSFDTRVVHEGSIKEFISTDSFTISGGGGTDFHKVMQTVETYKEENGDMSNILVIVFSDGFAPVPDPVEGVNVLWAICPGGAPESQFTWGEFIAIQ